MKMLLLFSSFILFVSVVEAQYTCTYLEWTGMRPYRQEKMMTKQCDYGCCGESVDQFCCDEPQEDDYRRHWVIAASIAGGILLLCVVIIVVLCVIKVKNVRHSRVYDGSSSSRATRQSPMCPAPPYYPVNIFIVDAERDRRHRVVQPQTDNTHETPPGGSRLPPVFNGEVSSPPPYSSVDANPASEWKRWQS